MVKIAKRKMTREKKDSPARVIVVGAISLGVGLAIGYYFGRQEVATSAPAAAAQEAAPLPNASAMLQDESRLRAVLLSNPKDLKALIQLGNLYYDHGRFAEAVDWYGRALEIDPGNPNVRTDRGTSYWNLGQADAAIDEYQKSLEADPSHRQTLYNLGVVYLHGKNDPVETRKAWVRLLEAHPDYPERAKVEEALAQLSSLPAGAATPGAEQKSGSPDARDLVRKLGSQP